MENIMSKMTNHADEIVQKWSIAASGAMYPTNH